MSVNSDDNNNNNNNNNDKDEEVDLSEKTNLFRTDTMKVDSSKFAEAPPCLLVTSGPEALMGKQWNLNRAENLIGRLASSDIHVAENSISKKHAIIESMMNRMWITDVGSTNGTFVNTKKIIPMQAVELKNNDQIGTGSVIFKYLERGVLTETAEKARMQTELQTVRNVQESFLPKKSQETYDWLKVSGFYRSATECSGDWWWHWRSDDKVFIIIGDVTGHGAGSAMITGAARSAISTVEDDASVSIEKVYSTLSTAINKTSAGKLSMSAFILEIDLKLKQIKYINASHLPAIILNGFIELKLWNKLPHIDQPVSLPLGAVAAEAKVGTIKADSVNRLVAFTDGFTERKNKAGTEINERDFYKSLIQRHDENLVSASGFLISMIQDSDQMVENAEPYDDLTMVVLDILL
jgi:serine phosphatase RsbU (regulator of sigma subunit)